MQWCSKNGFPLILVVVFLVVLSGCTKLWEEDLEGRYTGTFVRISNSLHNPPTAEVTLYLSDGKFSGTSSLPTYPALCSGTFSVKGKELQVNNSCFFTANFDWTLIFGGTYQYTQNGKELRIWKTYPDGSKDLYQLRGED